MWVVVGGVGGLLLLRMGVQRHLCVQPNFAYVWLVGVLTMTDTAGTRCALGEIPRITLNGQKEAISK